MNRRFERLDVRRRKWLWPPFVRITLPDPVRRNLLEVALWVLSFILPFLVYVAYRSLLSKTWSPRLRLLGIRIILFNQCPFQVPQTPDEGYVMDVENDEQSSGSLRQRNSY